MDKEKATKLVTKAKEAAHHGELRKSLQLFKEAYEIIPSEKLKKRIQKLEDFIANISSESEEEDEDMIDIGSQFYLHKSIATNLYEYQKKGVLWLWELHKRREGGILGDDMGLGKTIQVIAFLAGMFDADLIRHVLIVAPLSILVNWEKEIGKWAGGIRIKPFHGNAKKQRLKNLYKIQQKEGILITTYGMVVSNTEVICTDHNGEKFCWDYIILDEGHKIKNPTKTTKCVRQVPAKYHYILTGTPIQNNLNELWALFDFTQQGKLLGTRKTFDMEFQKPIVRAREKDASEYQQQVGNKIAESLRSLIAPYFLRRTKAEVFRKNRAEKHGNGDNKTDNNGQEVTKVKDQCKVPELRTRKNDLIIWLYLSELQLKLYQGFVESERVKQCLMTTRSPLAELNLLKKISDHPRLQSTLSKLLSSSDEQETRVACGIEADEQNTSDEVPLNDEPAHAPPVEKLIQDSGKMVFLVQLMENLRKENHRTIIFSQSRKMLDIMQKVFKSMDYKMLRIDGTINNPMDRDKIVQLFQTDTSYTVMMMTTQVGSVGLTLTGADRLVIFDPSWNPGTDAQAVDRVYRVGQTKNVVIYRLITCGSIEEKIYRKQIFKNAVMKQATGASNNPYRYFTNQELRELFLLDDPTESKTQMQLEEMHQHHDNTDKEFEKHLQFLKNSDCIFGVSHHDQLFSQEATNSDNAEFSELIEKQVIQAEQRVTEEFNNIDFSPSKSTEPVFESTRIIKPRDIKPNNTSTPPHSLELSMAALNLAGDGSKEDETSEKTNSSSHYVSVDDGADNLRPDESHREHESRISDTNQSQTNKSDISHSDVSTNNSHQSLEIKNDINRSNLNKSDDVNQSQANLSPSQPFSTAMEKKQSYGTSNDGDMETNDQHLSRVSNDDGNQSFATVNNSANIISQSNNTINDSNQSHLASNNTSQSYGTSSYSTQSQMGTTDISGTDLPHDSQLDADHSKPVTDAESTCGSLYHTVAMGNGNDSYNHSVKDMVEDYRPGSLIVISQEMEGLPNSPKSFSEHRGLEASYEAVDVGCSPLHISVVSNKHDSTNQDVSVVGVADIACSPCEAQSMSQCDVQSPSNVQGENESQLQHSKNVSAANKTHDVNNSLGTRGQNLTEGRFQESIHDTCGTNYASQDASQEKMEQSKEFYQATDTACSPLHLSQSQYSDKHESCASQRSESSINVKSPSCAEKNQQQQHEVSTHFKEDISCIDKTMDKIKNTLQYVGELGKSYRTPPVSPFVSGSACEKPTNSGISQLSTSTPIGKKQMPRRIINRSTLEQNSIAECTLDGTPALTNVTNSPENSSIVDSSANSLVVNSPENSNVVGSFTNSCVIDSPANSTANDGKVHETFYESADDGSMQISLRASDATDDSIYETKDAMCSPINDVTSNHNSMAGDGTTSTVSSTNDCSETKSDNRSTQNPNITQDCSEISRNSNESSRHSYENFNNDNSKCAVKNSSNDVDISVFHSESFASQQSNSDAADVLINVGESPSTTTTTTTNRRRTTAQTFFDETVESAPSASLTSEDSRLADTLPIDASAYEVDVKEETKEDIQEEPQLMQSATQDETTANTSSESVFDLDRLKHAKKEKQEKEEVDEDESQCMMVVKESMEEEDCGIEDSDDERKAVIDDSMEEKHGENDSETQDETESFEEHEDEEEQIETRSLEEIEARRVELLKLKSLMLDNMGNKEIDERLFIKIVDKMEQLKLFDML